MAYDKHTWTCDEPITVERLNHIEDGIAAGGDCDCGFECEEWVTLAEESVTTQRGTNDNYAYGDFTNSQLIDAESIKVTFNGTVYECEKIADTYSSNNYGAPYNDSTDNYDWSEYPFSISSESSGTYLYTETAGTYTIKIEAVEETISTTPCFDKARGYSCGEEPVMLTNETVTTVAQNGFNVGFFSYKQLINAETIRVTFDGVEYDCPRIAFDDYSMYGGVNPDTYMPDFSQYPFSILSNGTDNQIVTETAGTYSIKIEGMQEAVTTTQCFEKAVRSITSPLVVKASCAPSEGTGSVPSILDASPSEIQDAVKTRVVVVEDPHGNLYSVLYATDSAVTIISSQYDSNTEPPTVLEPYMYTYEDQIHLRYPQEGAR